MLKRDEIELPESCLNKAHPTERLFVLLARDPAAPVAIRAWVQERLRLGKNVPGDEQIREAFKCAGLMELERAPIDLVRRQEQSKTDWAEALQGSWNEAVRRRQLGDGMNTLGITWLQSSVDVEPKSASLHWQDFTALLMKPHRTPCTPETCSGCTCPHKQGPCWSPAVFESTGVGSSGSLRRHVATITLLVFDIDHTSADQIREIRRNLHDYRYLIHATHSDRPASRAVRFVIALSRPVLRGEWPRFWQAATKKIAPSADPACSDAGRIYYLPNRQTGADYLFDMAGGRALDVDAVLTNMPPDPAARSPIRSSGTALKIALDCDGLLCDFVSGALRIVEEVTGRRYLYTDINEFNFTKALGLTDRETAEVMARINGRQGFAAALSPYPNARQGVRQLRYLGEVFCVTSPWDSNPWWRQERDAWLALHFGIDVVHHAKDKSVYPADVFVDDRSKHVHAWSTAWPGRTAVLWRTPHNTSEVVPAGAHSLGSWEALYQIAREEAFK